MHMIWQVSLTPGSSDSMNTGRKLYHTVCACQDCMRTRELPSTATSPQSEDPTLDTSKATEN